MNKEKVIGIISAAATIIGVGASLVQDWVSDQKINIKIQQEVQKAISKK